MGKALNISIDSIYKTNETTIKAIAGYAGISKREIQSLTRDIYGYQEKMSDAGTKLSIQDICFSLASKADIRDDKTVKRFYDCIRSCHSYHNGNNSKKSHAASKKLVIKRDAVTAFLLSMSDKEFKSYIKDITSRRTHNKK